MGSHFERLPFTKKGSPPTPQASKKGRECLNGQRRLSISFITSDIEAQTWCQL